MVNRIHWTEQERKIVLEAAVDYCKRGHSYYEALRLGQLCLPTHRQRNMATRSAVVPDIKLLKEMEAQRILAKPAKDTPTVAEEMPPAPPVAPPQPAEDLINQTLSTLAQAIARQIVQSLSIELPREIKQLEHTFKLQKHNPEYLQTGSHLPKVVIIGLLNDQVHAIQREFGCKYNLKCIDTDRAMGMSPPDADAYLLMKNFINHPLYHKYQAFPNHVLIDGGMTTLRAWLNTKGQEL